MPNNLTAVLLVGGFGTRLRTVLPSVPKPLAGVGGKPFLELLVRQLGSQGVRRLVMCTGHMADQIETAFGDGRDFGVKIEYSVERQPMGTAGAIRLASRYLQGASEFLVMNGDSFLEIDFGRLIRFHRGHGALMTMAVWRAPDASRYGTVRIAAGRAVAFTEKTGRNTPGLINAGVYVFSGAMLDYIAETPASLERDVFPRLLDEGVYAMEQRGVFIDIGTPEDYARAQAICDRLRAAASMDGELCAPTT